VARAPERRPSFQTSSGITISDLYTPADTADLDEERDLGRPGDRPFTRGVQPTMYRGRFWTMRQYAGFATAAETNERFRYLLEQGQTGLSVAFDLPTQMGYDSDAPESLGEVGRVGVPVCSLEDMETLFAGIPLDKVSTSMTINATAAILLALYVAAAERRGVARAAISGTLQNDILKEYIARGTYIFPPRPSMRLVTDVFEFCSREVPRWNTISISGYHMREAGATAAQEIAFTMADAIAYVEAAMARGLDVDAFAGRLSFFFAAWSELFEEVAKFRAARRLWARIMSERFGAQDSRSMMCRFHVQTAGSSLTAQSIDNNVVRTTIQALAAVLGGAQSLHTNSRDEALALPTAEAARLALRTQQVLAHESGVTETPDPLELLRRDPDQRARGARPRAARRDRRPGRDAGCHRARLPAAPDPGVGLPRPAGDRVRGPDRGRRQCLPGRGGPDAADAADRPGWGAAPGGGCSTGSGRPGRGRLRCGPAARRRGRPRTGQPAPGAHRGRAGVRHGRRDLERAARCVGRAPRAGHHLRQAEAPE
jgi:methylmalonyl-CoA mutase N-terminal domain/subunit